MENTSNYTKIATFADERKLDRNAVTQYIRRHQEDFDGHITIIGRAMYADNEAIKMLENKYPLPKLIEVIRDPETDDLRKQVIALQAALIEAQKEIAHLTERAALADSRQMLIEDKEVQLTKQTAHIDELEKENASVKENALRKEIDLQHLKEQLSQESGRRELAEEKLNEVRNMSLLKRIFWKG